MSRLEASRTSEPLPPRPSALRPSPSARKVVGKWGTRLGTTIATPMAVTPTHEGEPAQGRGNGIPGTEPVTGVRRGSQEGGQQRDAGQRRTPVRHRDRVDRQGRHADENADGEHRAAVGRCRGGVVRHRLIRLAEQHAEGPPGLGSGDDGAPEVSLTVEDGGPVDEEDGLAQDDERARGRDPSKPHPDEGDERHEQEARAEPRRRGGEERCQRQRDGEGRKGREQGLDRSDAVHRAPTTWAPTTADHAAGGAVRASTIVVIQPEDCSVATVVAAFTSAWPPRLFDPRPAKESGSTTIAAPEEPGCRRAASVRASSSANGPPT